MVSRREKLAPLITTGMIGHLEAYIELFTSLEVPQDFVKVCSDINFEELLAGDFHQNVGRIFERLYKQNDETKIKVRERLRQFTLSDEAMDTYFSREAHIPSPYITDLVGMLPESKKDEFIEVSRKLMLECIREYLGLNK